MLLIHHELRWVVERSEGFRSSLGSRNYCIPNELYLVLSSKGVGVGGGVSTVPEGPFLKFNGANGSSTLPMIIIVLILATFCKNRARIRAGCKGCPPSRPPLDTYHLSRHEWGEQNLSLSWFMPCKISGTLEGEGAGSGAIKRCVYRPYVNLWGPTRFICLFRRQGAWKVWRVQHKRWHYISIISFVLLWNSWDINIHLSFTRYLLQKFVVNIGC